MPDTMDPQGRPEPQLSRAALSNGVELAYEVAGAGTPLVFIHGAMGDWRSWDRQWPLFTQHFQCLRYSRRYSYPNSNTMASSDHSALQEAQDLRLLIDHMGWNGAILVGSSYGSFTALALAVSDPQYCLALALSEPPMMRYSQFSAAGQVAAQEFRDRVIEPANAAFRRGDDVLAASIMTEGIQGGERPALPPQAMARRMQNLRAMRMLAMSSDEFPLLAPQALAALAMPVLLMAGRQTPAIHAEIFRNVCSAMPQAQQAWIEQSGHSTSNDNADAFNRTVMEFLQERLRAPGGR
jgi:pimeloyl-ACP methyl ester carboxylesterase